MSQASLETGAELPSKSSAGRLASRLVAARALLQGGEPEPATRDRLAKNVIDGLVDDAAQGHLCDRYRSRYRFMSDGRLGLQATESNRANVLLPEGLASHRTRYDKLVTTSPPR